MSDTQIQVAADTTDAAAANNPYLMALLVIAALCAVTGVTLCLIGQPVWGGGFLGTAATTILITLGAAAARWKP